MDLITSPDIYTPSVNTDGNYIDYIPIIINGLFCPCGTRKDKTYEKSSKFATHIKTKCHQKWLTMLNQNKANYYIELIKCKELLETQKQFIAKLESQLRSKTQSVEYLLEQITTNINNQPNVNLLDLD